MLDVPTAQSLLRRTRPRCHAEGYPSEVRSSVAELVRRKLGEGISLAAVARELDVNRGTLQRWLDRTTDSVAPTFVPVVVQRTAFPEAEQVIVPTTTPIALVSPTGFRLDGLTLEEAIHVLRELC